MDLLELTQTVARFSGTVDPRVISSAANSQGRVRNIVEYVREAWLEIQNEAQSWRFLTVPLPDTAVLVRGIPRVTPLTLLPGAPWANWLLGTGASRTVPLSVWPAPTPTTENRSAERDLDVLSWGEFRISYRQGRSAENPPTGQPQVVAIDPDDGLNFWPIPDVDYRLAGTYRRLPQELLNDDDIPMILPNHHMVIVRAALLKLYRHDEAPPQALYNAEQDLLVPMRALRRRYLYGARVGPVPAAIGPTGASVDIINLNTNIDFTLRNQVRQG